MEGRAVGMRWDFRSEANQNTGCPVNLEFQINSEYLFSISISQILLGSY